MMNNPYNYPGAPQQFRSMQGGGGYPAYPGFGPGMQGPGQPTAQATPPVTTGGPMPPGPQGPPVPMLPIEQSYVENILRLNAGKTGTFYMTYENNSQWNAKIFRGRIEAAGRDHIIISDPKTGMRYLLLMVNLDYVTFEEPLNYSYPFATPQPR